MRVRSPSTTLTLTMMVSPGWKSGISLPLESLAICSCSSSLIRSMGRSVGCAGNARRTSACQGGSGWRSFYDKECALSPFRSGFGPARGAGQIGRPEVGTPLAREPFRLGAAPGGHFGVIAGAQHLGDRPALEVLRPRVMRVFEQAGGEALLGGGGLLAHHPGQEAHAGIEQRQGGDLAAREDVIADGDLLDGARGDDAL